MENENIILSKEGKELFHILMSMNLQELREVLPGFDDDPEYIRLSQEVIDAAQAEST